MSSLIHQDTKKESIKELQFRIENLKSDLDDEKDKLLNEKNFKIRRQEEENREKL